MCSYLRQILARNEVVRLKKDFSQAALPRRIVLEVKTVEAMESVVRVHVQCVNAEVVGGET